MKNYKKQKVSSKNLLLLSILITLLFILSSCTKYPVMPTDLNSEEGTSITTPFGMLKPIEDRTIECIGKPTFLKTGYYQEDKNDDYITKTIVYYTKKDVYNDTINYFKTKTKECNYKKDTESTFSINLGLFKIINSKTEEYYKNNYDETLTINTILQEIEGKKYTIVQLQYEKYFYEEDNTNNINNEENNNEETNEENYQDVIPTGDAKKYDEQFRRIIERAIGKIHLESYGTTQNILTYIKYKAERKLTNNDASKIAEELEREGYTIQTVSIEDPQNTIGFYAENNKKMIVITFEPNYKKLELSVTTMS